MKSDFNGILPAYYSTNENATQIQHTYFNDMNMANDYMYFDYTQCDLNLTSGNSKLQPNYSALTNEWKLLKQLPFLNADQSHSIFRAFCNALMINNC